MSCCAVLVGHPTFNLHLLVSCLGKASPKSCERGATLRLLRHNMAFGRDDFAIWIVEHELPLSRHCRSYPCSLCRVDGQMAHLVSQTAQSSPAAGYRTTRTSWPAGLDEGLVTASMQTSTQARRTATNCARPRVTILGQGLQFSGSFTGCGQCMCHTVHAEYDKSRAGVNSVRNPRSELLLIAVWKPHTAPEMTDCCLWGWKYLRDCCAERHWWGWQWL